MDVRLLGDLVARERRSDDPALRAVSANRSYAYREVCTTAAKAGNFLRYLGVGETHTVEVEPEPIPEPALTFLGAGLLGAATRFGPTGDARVVVVPREREAEFDLPPGSKLVVYGGPPERPGVAHWETEVWSENPAFPPTEVDPDAPALVGPRRAYSHADLLDAGGRVADAYGIRRGTTVAVRGSLSEPGVVAAGIVAPLLAGGTVVFPDESDTYDVGVGVDSPDELVVDPGDVL